MRDTYAGATQADLRATTVTGRVVGLVAQDSVFNHHGEIAVGNGRLTLQGWLTLQPSDIADVKQTFIDEYRRWSAAGDRGGYPSLGVLERFGAPLVLSLHSGDQIVLLVGFNKVTGKTRNRQWLPVIEEFAGLSVS